MTSSLHSYSDTSYLAPSFSCFSNTMSPAFAFSSDSTQSGDPVHVEKERIIVGDCTNSIKRWLIPGFASSQDKKVSAYFIDFFSS